MKETRELIRVGLLGWVVITLALMLLGGNTWLEQVDFVRPWVLLSVYFWGAVLASWLGSECGIMARKWYWRM